MSKKKRKRMPLTMEYQRQKKALERKIDDMAEKLGFVESIVAVLADKHGPFELQASDIIECPGRAKILDLRDVVAIEYVEDDEEGIRLVGT